jgi:hypothetical protein
MKRILTFVALGTLLLVGCGKSKEFHTHAVSGEQCYQLDFEEQIGPWGTSVGLKVSYELAWPDRDVVSPSAERELMFLCFGDSSAANVDDAVKAWLAAPFFYNEEDGCTKTPIAKLDEEGEYSYVNLESSCDQDSALAVFTVKNECFFLGAAHGMYSVDFLTVDKASGNVIHLADLVTDTALLCEAIAHAIQDLEVNKDTRECLFDEFIDAERMPLPRNFLVDSARNNITVFYGLYEITPYCCGIQGVVLPIFWLSKHVPLTPYTKRLFGPESYIEN